MIDDLLQNFKDLSGVFLVVNIVDKVGDEAIDDAILGLQHVFDPRNQVFIVCLRVQAKQRAVELFHGLIKLLPFIVYCLHHCN